MIRARVRAVNQNSWEIGMRMVSIIGFTPLSALGTPPYLGIPFRNVISGFHHGPSEE
jgi:hypothetical protein